MDCPTGLGRQEDIVHLNLTTELPMQPAVVVQSHRSEGAHRHGVELDSDPTWKENGIHGFDSTAQRRRSSTRAGSCRTSSFRPMAPGVGRESISVRTEIAAGISTSRPLLPAFHAIDNGAPIAFVSTTLGHSDLKTTSVYAYARPGESSGRYVKTKF